jgi:alpha-glucosidase
MGFSPAGVETWLPFARDSERRNVAVEGADPASMLQLFHALTRLRAALPALTVGAYRELDGGEPGVLAYARDDGDERIIVALNLTGEPASPRLDAGATVGRILLSTGLDRTGSESLATLSLRPNEGVVVRVAVRNPMVGLEPLAEAQRDVSPEVAAERLRAVPPDGPGAP